MREPGYYFVKFISGSVTIAAWDQYAWTVVGSETLYDDEDFKAISEEPIISGDLQFQII